MGNSSSIAITPMCLRSHINDVLPCVSQCLKSWSFWTALAIVLLVFLLFVGIDSPAVNTLLWKQNWFFSGLSLINLSLVTSLHVGSQLHPHVMVIIMVAYYLCMILHLLFTQRSNRSTETLFAKWNWRKVSILDALVVLKQFILFVLNSHAPKVLFLSTQPIKCPSCCCK